MEPYPGSGVGFGDMECSGGGGQADRVVWLYTI